MKSKTPWRAGPVPVANDVQATGDCGGFVEASGRKSPLSASARRRGSFPSSIQRDRRRGSTPSKPRITRRRAGRRPGLRASCPPPQPPAIVAATAIATTIPRRALPLGKLAVELDGIAGDAQPARGELVEVLRLPVEEALLLEVLHVRGELLVRHAEPGRQRIARVQVGHVRRRVVDAPVLEQDRALRIHGDRIVYHSRTMLSPLMPA